MSAAERKFARFWQACAGPTLTPEHRFLQKRRFRFDFAHLPTKTAVEIEGGIWTRGAHTRGRHFESDCEKYNLAGMAGWTVLRLTPEMITVPWIEKIVRHVKEAEG